jgi:hypothetical protein
MKKINCIFILLFVVNLCFGQNKIADIEKLKDKKLFEEIYSSYIQYRSRIKKSLVKSSDEILLRKTELENLRLKLDVKQFKIESEFHFNLFLKDLKTNKIPISKNCIDKIELSFNKKQSCFELVIADNNDIPEFGCVGKELFYSFIIKGNKIQIIDVDGAG